MYRVWNFVTQYSILLIAGAIIALVWANIDAHSYHDFVEFVLIDDFLTTLGSFKHKQLLFFIRVWPI